MRPDRWRRPRPYVTLIFQGQKMIPGVQVGDRIREIIDGHFCDIHLRGLKEKQHTVIRGHEAMRYHADVEISHWSGCPCSSTFEAGTIEKALLIERAKVQSGLRA